jgi:general stress protein 26
MDEKDIKLITESPMVALSTISLSGYPQTRNMLNLRNAAQYPSLVPFFANYSMADYFFGTNTSSAKMDEIRHNSKACIYFTNPNTWHGLTLSGDIYVVDDEEIKRAIWQDGWEMYYKGGLSSPDYSILHLKVKQLNKYYQLEKSVARL